MRQESFQRALWRRFLLDRMQTPLVLGCALMAVLGLVDWHFRFAVIWRLFALAVFLGLMAYRLYRVYRETPRPTDEELIHFAMVRTGDMALASRSTDLTFDRSWLGPLGGRLLIIPVLIFGGSACHELGQTGLSRMFLLSGEWPRRTRIADVSVPAIVEYASPLTVSFTTEGLIPRVVRLDINGTSRPLVGNGKPYWSYDVYPDVGEVSIVIRAGDDVRSDVRSRVVPAPVLAESKVVVESPAYLGGGLTTTTGLQVEAPEGSSVNVSARFENAHELRLEDGTPLKPLDGWVTFGVDDLSENTVLQVEGRAHADLRWHEVASWKIRMKKDFPPTVDLKTPRKLPWLLATSTLAMTFEATDDNGLKELVLRDGDQTILRADLQGRRTRLDVQLDLKEHDVANGALSDLKIVVSDQTGKVSDPLSLPLSIVDLQTFRERLLEHQQVMHRTLEQLLSSVSRRIRRHERSKQLETGSEMGLLKDDMRLSDQLAELWGQYVSYLRQLEGMERSITSNRRHADWMRGTLVREFADQLSADSVDLESQKSCRDRLAEISAELARSQDMHLVLRMLDEMIEKQREVVSGIPAP